MWYAALDSRRNLAADCISQNSICLILRFWCFCNLVNGLYMYIYTHVQQDAGVSPELVAIGGQGCPAKLFSLIFIGFH